MPTKRTRTRRTSNRTEFPEALHLHIETGDCLLAGAGRGCGCGLIDEEGRRREELMRDMPERKDEKK